MKWYGHCPGASMEMHADPAIFSRLEALIRGADYGPVSVAIETGTFLGTGSTRLIAETFRRVGHPYTFHTIEVNYESAMVARKNLAPYPGVVSHWGSTVHIEQAAAWLAQDEVLKNTSLYPDIWIDHLDPENSVRHYAAEVRGSSAWANRPEWEGEALLERLLIQHRNDKPLVVLDSAGGIGWLEFNIMVEVMEHRPYHVLLDDVQHIKHFRSLAYMRAGNGFRIIVESGKAALAVHSSLPMPST